MLSTPDDKILRDLVYLKYWALLLRPLLVHVKVLIPPKFTTTALNGLVAETFFGDSHSSKGHSPAANR